ncbi:MAG: SpaA isopeptide-forming pilin-related protein [Clostridiaceae bacterium]
MKLTLTLKGTDGTVLSGTNFNLKNSLGVSVATGTTDAVGKITWSGSTLVYGNTYTIEQTSVNTGYKIAQPQSVKLTSTETTVNFVNTMLAKINLTLLKVDSTTPIAGAEFIIKDQNYNIVGSLMTTDSNGKLTFTGLETGQTYIVEQVSTPAGYLPVQPFNITTTSEVTIQTIYNSTGTTTVNSLIINAVDKANPSIKLEGAEFKVTGPGGTFYVTTNKDGFAALTNLPYGTYTVIQTKVPVGYVASTASYSVPVANTISILTVENLNTGTTLSPAIIKATVLDWDTSKPIQGVTIRLTDNLGNTLYATTDVNGVVTFGGLDVTRTYVLTSTSAPFEYGRNPYISTGPLTFIKDSATPLYIEATLKIQKIATKELVINVMEYGDTTIPIVGAILDIYKPDGTIYNSVTTTSNGSARIMLPAGYTYTVKQRTSDATHLISSQIYSVKMSDPNALFIPNKLIAPQNSIRSISVTKAWDGTTTWPSGITSVSIDVLGNGVKVGNSQIISSSTTNWTTTFNVPKYDADHLMINYTIKENPVTGYYPIYTSTDNTGNNWKVTNYKGVNTTPSESCSPLFPPQVNNQYKIAMTYLASNFGLFEFLNPATGKNDTLLAGFCADRNTTWVDKGYYYSNMEFFNEQQLIAKPFNIGIAGNVPITQAKLDELRKVMAYAHEVFLNPTILNSILLTDGPNNISRMNYAEGLGYAVWHVLYDYVPTFNSGYPVRDTFASKIYNAALAYDPSNPSGYLIGTGTTTIGNSVIQNINPSTIGTNNTYKLNFLISNNGTPGNLYQKGTQSIVTVQKCTTTYTVTSIDVFGQKTWVNDTPADRPASITVQLMQKIGTGTWSAVSGKTQSVTPDINGNWTYNFKDLPTYSGNDPITYSVTETIVPSGYTVTYDGYNITNKLEKTPFSILKLGEKNIVLPGAEFTLYGSTTVAPITKDLNKIIQGPLSTDSNGALTFSPLKIGTYYLKETKAPIGYMLSDTYYRVVVSLTSGTMDVKVYSTETGSVLLSKDSIGRPQILNQPYKGQMYLKKVDGFGNILPGAVFTLTQGTTTTTYTVDSSGILLINNLAPGDYILTETTTPPEYYPNTNVYYINVDQEGKVIVRLNDKDTGIVLPSDPLVIANYKKATLVIKKVDDKGNILPGNGADVGAKFTLTGNAPLTYTQTVTVDSNGLVKFVDLQPGTYTLKESRAPDGYMGELRTYIVTIGTDGKITIRLGEQDVTPALNDPLIVVNKRLGEYPKTGGIGSLIFYASGLLISSGAGLMIYRRRRLDDPGGDAFD